MMKELEYKYQDINGFTAGHHSIPCFGHVLNITVSEILRKGDTSMYGLRSDLYANTLPQSDRNNESSSAATLILDNPVNKLRAGVLKILASVRLRDEFLMCCRVENLKPRLLCYDVATRWGSTLNMIERVLSLITPYNRTCGVIDSRVLENDRALFGEDGSDADAVGINGMYVLDDVEVLYLREVTSILDPFQQVTNWVSGEKYPTMSRSIVLFNTLLDHLEKKIVVSHVFPPGEASSCFNGQSLIFKGCWLGRLKLLKYYMKTDNSKVYPISTFCDSSIKNRFWTSSNWGKYGDVAMKHVEDEWNENYKPLVQEKNAGPVDYASNSNIFAQIALDLHDEIESERDVNDDELELYKRERPTKFDIDIVSSAANIANRQHVPTNAQFNS
ncbi:hypothetical protein EDC94DRAFT_613797 [Helicostylum pulchrum]|nr:hypothetical protein EDC94DRAFT_613797 [Helicostylum pulchrum]